MLDGNRPCQIDSWYHHICAVCAFCGQGSSKVAATSRQPRGISYRSRRVTHGESHQLPVRFVLKGGSDEEVVAKAQAHAKEVHQIDLSREQALAMAEASGVESACLVLAFLGHGRNDPQR